MDEKPALINISIWAAPSEFVTYRLCEQRRFRRACASAQSRQNLRCSLIQAVSQEEPSDRKPDPWPLWMAGHAQLKFVMTECSKTQIRLTRPIWCWGMHFRNVTGLLIGTTLKVDMKTFLHHQKLCPKIFLNREFSIEKKQNKKNKTKQKKKKKTGGEVIIFLENFKNLKKNRRGSNYFPGKFQKS